ncbi:MAG: hypothetical protein GEV06_18370 [Luteitalea sp.]|nr:hypothetical protein [Luteitalea sp.]
MLPGRKYTPEDVLSLVWQRRWLILVPLFVCSFAALLYSRSKPDLYQSQALIGVIPQRIPDSYVQSTVTSNVQERLRSLTQQILSRTRLERIIQDFGLYGTLQDVAPMEDVVDSMRNIIEVQAIGSTNRRQAGETFHVRFTYPDPQLAQRVTERLASLFIEENSQERESAAESTNQFLDAQLSDARARLEAQEKKLEQFREQHAGRLPTQMQSNLQAINGMHMQLQSTLQTLEGHRSRRLMLQQLYGDAAAEETTSTTAEEGETESASSEDESESGVTVPEGLPVPTSGPASQQLAAAKTALGQAELRLKPEHPDIVRLKRLIGDLERKVAEDAKNPPDPNVQPALTPEEERRQERLRQTRAEMEALDRQIGFRESEEERIRGRIAEYEARLEAVPGLESEWIRLTRDYETLQRQYRSLLQKSENSKVAMNLERRQISEQFRIIDAARLPTRPVSPNRLQISVAGLAAGLLLGLALVALFEWRDSSFRTDGDVVGVLALPVLAVIPHVATRAERMREARRRFLVTSAAVGALVVAGGTFWFLELWKFVR